jgi:hypothetical protein
VTVALTGQWDAAVELLADARSLALRSPRDPSGRPPLFVKRYGSLSEAPIPMAAISSAVTSPPNVIGLTCTMLMRLPAASFGAAAMTCCQTFFTLA